MTKEKRTKWGVVGDSQYVTGPNGGIAWSYERAEAEMVLPTVKGGRVVDVEAWLEERRAEAEAIRAARLAPAPTKGAE